MKIFIIAAILGLGVLPFAAGAAGSYGPGPAAGAGDRLQIRQQLKDCTTACDGDQLRLMAQDQLRIHLGW